MLALSAPGLVEAVEAADGAAHAQGHVHGGQRGHCTQGIAADVAHDGALVLVQGVEQAPVGAAGAHDGGTGGDDVLQSLAGMYRAPQLGGHQVLGELALQGEHVLAQHVQADFPAVVLQEGIQLLHHGQFVHRSSEVQDLLLGQRPHHAQLEHRMAVSKDLLYVLVGGAGGEDAQGTVAAILQAVQWAGLGVLGQLPGALLHHRMAADGVAGHHDILGDVLLIGADGGLHTVAGLHQGL